MRHSSLKILHIANFKTDNNGSMFYNTDAKIQHGLIELGHYVHAFDYKYMVRKSNIFNTTSLSHKKTHQQLIELCQNVHFDLILIGHIHLPKELLKQLKAINQAKVAMWFVDPINEPHRLDHFKEMHSEVDHVFVTTAGQHLQNLSEVCDHPVFAFTPNLSLHSIEYAREDWLKFDYDCIFCGSNSKYPEREQFISHLTEQLPEFKFKLGACLGQPSLFGHEYQAAVRNSLMGINYSKYNDIYMYSSDRLAQLTGMGCLVFTAQTPGLAELFPEDSVVYFQDTSDLLEKLKYYQQHPEKAVEIAQRGYALAHSIFEAKYILQQWLNLINQQPLNSPWQAEIYQQGNRMIY
ncbi:glycosyltransferase [Acinetobacter sp. ANC 3791]|uniref:glycosyltransferase family protein n=1 Tax=Acinetobacter sp. ANC 3791 TaxID=2529836 RepID=UPI001039CDAA|nr:glycosyltransferase [Acinetobacter sp. ANC 3791]TCB84417.1 glycosyltransferase family 1 protein [Acinetobacter sp. ANC 3791]